MAIELKHSVRQSQNLLLSPQIQQAIKILTLGRAELQDFVSEELKENPCLEESPAKPGDSQPFETELHSALGLGVSGQGVQSIDAQTSNDGGFAESDPSLADLGQSLISAISFSGDEHSSSNSGRDQSDFDVPLYDSVRKSTTDLHEEIESQLRMMHLTDLELHSALIILQYVDDEGYLTSDPKEIAQEHEIDHEDCLYGLEAVQRCEPSGVGARNLQECLLLQLRALPEIPALAERIISDFWVEIEKVDVKRISKALHVDIEEVKETIRFIRSELDPKPARQFGENSNHAVEPDVYVFMRDNRWVVSLNEDGLPRLRVSKHYEKLLAQIAGGPKGHQSAEVKTFVNTRIKSAKWLVRAIAERNKTILRVTEVIAAKQSRFLESGVEGMAPLTLRQVAEELGLHESTISRTTNNKYVQTPQGLFELKYFFNSSMTRDNGEQLSSETIRMWVGDLIRNETVSKPLSDQEIANTIAKTKNVPVARRTIAKYREALGIPSSSQRLRKF